MKQAAEMKQPFRQSHVIRRVHHDIWSLKIPMKIGFLDERASKINFIVAFYQAIIIWVILFSVQEHITINIA